MAKQGKTMYHGERPCVVVKRMDTDKPVLIRYTDDHGGLCRVFDHELSESKPS